MKSFESTQISDCNNPTEPIRYTELFHETELKSKIMTEDLYLNNLPLNDSVYSVPILPNEKKCQYCRKYKEEKKLWYFN